MSGVGVVTELPVLGWGTLGYPGVKVCPAWPSIRREEIPPSLPHHHRLGLLASPGPASALLSWAASLAACLGEYLIFPPAGIEQS